MDPNPELEMVVSIQIRILITRSIMFVEDEDESNR